ncbi:hypothetical protein ACTQ3U_11540, partial [Oscillospiraceae bacterium LCP25S3_F9]
ILDVLPYNGDTRVGYGNDNGGTTGSDVHFKLKTLKIKQSGTATIRGVYYSQNSSVQGWLTNGGKDAAQNLSVSTVGSVTDTTGQWQSIGRAEGGGGTFTPDAENVTAVAVS